MPEHSMAMPVLTGGAPPFDVFVAEHRERAVRVAWRLCGADDATAQDVAQDAFLRASVAFHLLRDPVRLEAWFYRTLVHVARNHCRWRAVRQRFTAPWREPSIEVATRDPGLQRRIQQALDALPEGQREAFVLVHLEGWTIVEAAAHSGRATGTMKSHLSRALARLRDSLRDLDPGAGP